MNKSYRNIKDYAFSEHTEAFRILTRVFRAFSIHYFLIGAQARDVHFFQKGIRPVRGTRDIDFAVMVDSLEEYEKLMIALKSEGFEETKDPYRLNWNKGSTVIDLLPFGQIEEDYTVNFDKREIEISVLGYKEINEELGELYLDEEESLSLPVPPLHGIFILKLLSWDEKKPDREKDLKDLGHILKHYWEFVEEEAFEKHLDLFDDNFTTEKAAARILGRHLRKTCERSQMLKETVIRILKEQTSQLDPPGLMLYKLSDEQNKTIDEVKLLLDEILKGINDKT